MTETRDPESALQMIVNGEQKKDADVVANDEEEIDTKPNSPNSLNSLDSPISYQRRLFPLIDVRNPRKLLESRLPDGNHKYAFNLRLIIVLVVCLANVLAYNAGSSGLAISVSVVVIAVGLGLLLYCFCCQCKQKRSSSVGNISSNQGDDKEEAEAEAEEEAEAQFEAHHSFVMFFNSLIYTPSATHRELYTNDIRIPLSLIQVLVIIYACGITLGSYIVMTPYADNFDECVKEIRDTIGKNHRSACIMGSNSNVSIYATILCFAQLTFMKVVHKDVKKGIKKLAYEIFVEYPCTKKYKNDVDNELREFKRFQQWDTKEWFKSNRIKFGCVFVICWFYHVASYGYSRHNIFDSGYYTTVSVVVCNIMYIIDAFVATATALTLVYVAKQFQFPSVITNAMGESLLVNVHKFYQDYEKNGNGSENRHGYGNRNGNGNGSGSGSDSERISMCLEYVVGWWVLREFYVRCLIHYYSRSFSQVIGFGLIGSFLMATSTFVAWSFDFDSELFWSFAAATLLALLITIATASNSVTYLNSQTTHAVLMNKLQMQFRMDRRNVISKMNNSDNNNNNNYTKKINDDFEDLLSEDGIVSLIVGDIKNNCYALRVFGITIDEGFMLFLRASASALVVALLAEVID